MLTILACIAAATSSIVADTGADQRAAIQAAIDAAPAGGEVCLPAGDLVVLRPPAGLGNPDRLSDLRTRRGVRLVGAGLDRTRVLMAGGDTKGRYLIDLIGAEGVAIEDLTLDGSQRTSGAEQQHLLHLDGARHVRVRNVRFRHPWQATHTGGDCVFSIGSSDVVIEHSVFESCARSSVTWQRGNSDWHVRDSVSIDTHDTDFDAEPTGVTPDAWLRDITIERVAIRKASPAIAISLTRGTGFRIVDVTIDNGSLFVMSAIDSVIDRVTIACPPGRCAIVRRAVSGLLVRDSSLRGAGGGDLVSIFADPDGAPEMVVFDHVRFEQPDGAAAVIVADDVRGLFVSASTFVGTSSLRPLVPAIVMRGITRAVVGAVSGSTFEGVGPPRSISRLPGAVSWFASGAP